MTPQEKLHEQAEAMRHIILHSAILEMKGLEVLDSTKQELKQRVRSLIYQAKQVQQWFIGNQKANPRYIRAFKDEMFDKALMLSELLRECWDFPPDELEELIGNIRQAREEAQNATQTQ